MRLVFGNGTHGWPTDLHHLQRARMVYRQERRVNNTESADGEKPWWCYICAFRFNDRASAEAHVSSVHGQEPATNEERNARGY
jgi:hypothetical protein